MSGPEDRSADHRLRDVLRHGWRGLPNELRSAGALLVLRELTEWRDLDPSSRQLEEATGQHRSRIRRYLDQAVACGLLVVLQEASAGGRGRRGRGRRYGLGPLALQALPESGDARSPVSGAAPPESGDATSPVSEKAGTKVGTKVGTPRPPHLHLHRTDTPPPTPPRDEGGPVELRIAARRRRPRHRDERDALEAYGQELGLTLDTELRDRIRDALRDGWAVDRIRSSLERRAGRPRSPPAPERPLPTREALRLWEGAVCWLESRVPRRSWLTWLRAGTWGYRLDGERLVVGVATPAHQRWLAGHVEWRPLYLEALAAGGHAGLEVLFETGLPGG